MPAELDPFIERLTSKPDWLPTWSNLPWAAIADAGDPAYRRALARWNAVREGTNASAYAAVAVLLLEAFDDDRAMLALAEATDRATMFEAVLPYAQIMTPRGRCVRTLSGLFLTRMVHELSEGRLRIEIIDAIRHMRIDDRGEAYLPTRRALASQEIEGPVTDKLERYSDRLLLAAAESTPDRADVLRTVLSYWGQAEPLDDVPTAEPVADEAPASWRATCALIGGLSRAADAEQLIELAHDTDFWREGDLGDAEAYVDALETSAADLAEDKLLDIAKADVPVSGRAVRSIARRRTAIAGVPPITQPRIDAVVAALVESGVIAEGPGPRGMAVVQDEAATSDTPLDLAALVLGACGRAVTFNFDAGPLTLTGHVRRTLQAIALAAGHTTLIFQIDDQTSLGLGVEVRDRETGVLIAFRDGRLSPGELDALVPDSPNEAGEALQRIRIDPDHVTYAHINPASWSSFLDWAASGPLPETSPVPPRRKPGSRGQRGFLGMLFGG